MLWVLFLIFLALAFDYLNGFHDAANSVSTVISTRVLSPRVAIWWATAFNFLACFIFHMGVAKTIGGGIVDISIVDTNLVFAALLSACLWNLITWWFGLPSSSSHALIGGIIGAALVKAGPSSLITSGILKIIAFIVVAPILGMVLSFIVSIIVYRIGSFFKYRQVDAFFKKAELFSAASFCLGYGGNDAQKTMGIIMMILFSALAADPETAHKIANVIMTEHELAQFHVGAEIFVPWSVKLACYGAIALGTLSGGWRIIKTMGQKITHLKPIGGFCAESGASLSLFISSWFGIPVSTTHIITGGIVGAGMFKRFSAVHWGVARRIVWAWVITMPAAGAIAALSYFLKTL